METPSIELVLTFKFISCSMINLQREQNGLKNKNNNNNTETRNTGASPFSFTISVLVSFTYITQHTGPTALRPIRRTKQLWSSVLLKDTSAATGQTGIQTHILTAPDRSATTLQSRTISCYFEMKMQLYLEL